MRSWRPAAAAAALAVATALGAPPADARTPFIVRKFLLGHLEPDTGRFLATGGRGTANAFRDDVLLLVFSAPLDFDSVGDRTVRIGIPSGNGLQVAAEGAFYRYSVNRFDPVSGTYVEKRTWRNRVLFDPMARREIPFLANPEGFRPRTTYAVTLPGIDAGALKAVESASGTLLETTFATTFATTDEFLADRLP